MPRIYTDTIPTPDSLEMKIGGKMWYIHLLPDEEEETAPCSTP